LASYLIAYTVYCCHFYVASSSTDCFAFSPLVLSFVCSFCLLIALPSIRSLSVTSLWHIHVLTWINFYTDNSTPLDYYAANSGDSLPTFRENLSVPSSRVKNPRRFLKIGPTLGDGTDRLSRNLSKELSQLAA
jgi:hypothetical protein